MGEIRKQFTGEFKLKAVRLVEESGRSKARIARELGIQESLLKRWKTQREGQGATKAEIRRLRRDIDSRRARATPQSTMWVEPLQPAGRVLLTEVL